MNTKIKYHPSLRELWIVLGLATFMGLTWLGPYLTFGLPVSWVQNWFFGAYACLLHQQLFPFFYTWVPSRYSEIGFFSLAPYAFFLSLLFWMPVLFLFAHLMKKRRTWIIAVIGFLYIHLVAILLIFLIKGVGWNFIMEGT